MRIITLAQNDVNQEELIIPAIYYFLLFFAQSCAMVLANARRKSVEEESF